MLSVGLPVAAAAVDDVSVRVRQVVMSRKLVLSAAIHFSSRRLLSDYVTYDLSLSLQHTSPVSRLSVYWACCVKSQPGVISCRAAVLFQSLWRQSIIVK